MDEKEYQHLLVTETSPWVLAKNELILSFLKRFSFPRAKVLDVGCGMGGLMLYLQKNGFKVQGIDCYQGAVKFCQQRGLAVKKSGAESLPYPKNRFDLIIASELIEHLKEPVKAIAEFSRVLKPKGLLILTVPAFSFLWHETDVAAHHVKRYCVDLLETEAGKHFKTIKLSYIFFFAFLPMFLLRFFRRFFKEKKGKRLRDEFAGKPKILEKIILFLFRIENFFLCWIDFPFGVGIIGVFRNKKVK